MNKESYWKVVGYLQAYADLKTCIDGNVFYTFTFDCIENTGVIEKSLKDYFADAEFILSASELSLINVDNNAVVQKHQEWLKNYRLHIEKVLNWKEELYRSFTFWTKNIFEDVQTNTYNCFFDLLSEAFGSKQIEAWNFGLEDSEFVQKFFGFVVKDIFIFATDEKIYILVFGLDD